MAGSCIWRRKPTLKPATRMDGAFAHGRGRTPDEGVRIPMAESRKGVRHVSTTGSKHEEVASSSSDIEEVVLTLDKHTHEVLNVARLDTYGHRKDLSEQDWTELAGK